MNTPKTDQWETNYDDCYYHMWRLRRKTERGWHDGFHVNTREEAKGLCDLLNKLERELDELRRWTSATMSAIDSNLETNSAAHSGWMARLVVRLFRCRHDWSITEIKMKIPTKKKASPSDLSAVDLIKYLNGRRGWHGNQYRSLCGEWLQKAETKRQALRELAEDSFTTAKITDSALQSLTPNEQ